MRLLIKIVSVLILLLGVIHISLAFPFQSDIDTLWFVGAGMAIVFGGFINLIAIDRGASSFAIIIAITTNVFNCVMFCFALSILDEPQVYLGVIVFLIAAVAFVILLVRRK